MKEEKKIQPADIRLIALSRYFRPDPIETVRNDWVLNGQNNSFYEYLISRYKGSSTNSAILNSYVDLTYGQGLMNVNNNVEDWMKFRRMITDEQVLRIVTDYTILGEGIIQVVKANNPRKIPKLYHLPKELTAPQKVNEDNEIEGYYYCENWRKSNQDEYAPDFMPILNEKKGTDCFPIKPYRVGAKYFSDPEYLAGLPYAVMEEEISNYYVSHIQNGLSFGYIINIPDGNSYSEEEKEEIEKKIKGKLTGSSNAGKFIINFNGRDAEITVQAIEVNDAHKQWEYLTTEARQQLLTAHRVTSPMLFGIKDNTGFGNNAEEMDTAEAQLMKRVILPKQKYILNAFMTIAEFFDLNLNLKFKPLTDPIEIDKKEIVRKDIKLSEVEHWSNLVEALSQDAPEGYEIHSCEDVIDEKEDFDFEEHLNSNIKFADIESAPLKRSAEDTPVFKVRYRYKRVLQKENHREFCTQMHNLSGQNKYFRKADINFMSFKGVNNQFGHKGQNYSIFLYKGGVNCSDIWERVVFKKKIQSNGKPFIGNPLQNVTVSTEAEANLNPMPADVSVPPYDMKDNGHHPNWSSNSK